MVHWPGSRARLLAAACTATVAACAAGLVGTPAASSTTDAQVNLAHLTYTCTFPGSTAQSVVADVGTSATSSALTLTYASVTFSAPAVDELRALGATTVGGVFGPVIQTSTPATLAGPALGRSRPVPDSGPMALVGTWVGAPPTYDFSNSADLTVTAPSFVLQIASTTADGSAVDLPASITCEATPGASNQVFHHSAAPCSNLTCTSPSPSQAPSPTPPPASPTPPPDASPTASPAANLALASLRYVVAGSISAPVLSASAQITAGSLSLEQVSAGSSVYNATLQLPTARAHGNLFGLMPYDVGLNLSQVGPGLAIAAAANQYSLDVSLTLSLESFKVAGAPPGSGGTCATAQPVAVHFSPSEAGGSMAGTFQAGHFSGCGVLGVVLSAAANNVLRLTLTAAPKVR